MKKEIFGIAIALIVITGIAAGYLAASDRFSIEIKEPIKLERISSVPNWVYPGDTFQVEYKITNAASKEYEIWYEVWGDWETTEDVMIAVKIEEKPESVIKVKFNETGVISVMPESVIMKTGPTSYRLIKDTIPAKSKKEIQYVIHIADSAAIKTSEFTLNLWRGSSEPEWYKG